MRRSTTATLAIVLITAIWGSTFFIIKDAVALVDPVDFLAVRFAIGALLPAILFWRPISRLTPRQWLIALALGGVYGLAQIAQTIGLQTTAASVSGFITGTYVVITPLIMWAVFRSRLASAMWLAVALAVAGLGILSLNGVMGGGVGELLTLVGAALYAVHIVLLDRWSRAMDASALATVQLVGVAIVCGLAGAPGGYQIPADSTVWGAILYTAIAAGIVTMLLQTWAQRHITPTRVVLLMTLEPVFASVFAILFGGEFLTARLLIGGSLILLATVLGSRSDAVVTHEGAGDNRSPATNETTSL
ncbi:MAG TPA: DMT family transporter [Tessaracoccus flavescens]|uniref:DMT family transporter n=1 Tax=Tessaracoccus flavescens TaxID=399497 RepID=A0A921EQ35_9ACTN|nr:DMT family transporter [Tessaracoccus flavescens]